MTIRTSRAIRGIPFLDSLIEQELSSADRDGVDLYLGWGSKPSGKRAQLEAANRQGRALFLEDGFLRSYGTGETHPPVSLAVDRQGIYYDATRPSDLEDMLASEGEILASGSGVSAIREEDVRRAKALVIKHGLSKYNFAPPLDKKALKSDDVKRVLVVDQTAGDLSIGLGLASAECFQLMLQAALDEHPDATIYLKTHPEVSGGRKAGHFAADLSNDRVVPLVDPVQPMSLIREMDHVYVVSSTMGFEALLAGKPVTCFGMPWYAGWGATDDRVSCSRRQRKRSVEELFAAGCMRYCRYIDPVTLKRGTIFDAIDWLVRQIEIETVLHGPTRKGRVIGFGMRRWKQANLAPLLGTMPGTAVFAKNVKALEAQKPCAKDRILCWGGRVPPNVQAVANRTGANALRMEDGFIRSVGLGSDLIPPLSIVLDAEGIYFDPTQPSELERILSEAQFCEGELERAAALRELVVDRGITKYNLEPRRAPAWESKDRRVVLVIGQVEDDASVLLGCPDVRTNLGLLRAARQANPDAFIVYKPHPDVWSGNRKGRVNKAEALALADHIEMRCSVVSCIDASDQLHTLTSLSGFDALLRGVDVVTYGQPFYAGWGLTKDRAGDALAFARRLRRLSLDELVAGTLLRYPLYWDDKLRGYTTAEAIVNHISDRLQRLESGDKELQLGSSYLRRKYDRFVKSISLTIKGKNDWRL